MRPGWVRAAGLFAILAFAACGRKAPPDAPPAKSQIAAAAPHFAVKPVTSSEGVATWYDVPEGSLPERRAWAGELTAASNKAPMGCYLRVTRLDNARSVIVRVTDTGARRNTALDLSKEAAAQLGMVTKGETRVRVEQLALENADDHKPTSGKDEPPSVRMPLDAADAEAERRAAAQKTAPAP